MKSKLTWVLLALLLPLLSIGQTFTVNELLKTTDAEFFASELHKRSPLLQQLYAAASESINISEHEANNLVSKRLKELNDEDLNKLYAAVSSDDRIQIGVMLYLLMNHFANLYPGVDANIRPGVGIGAYLMYSFAQIMLMPELSFAYRSFGDKYGAYKTVYTMTVLSLALTAMYALELGNFNLLFGLSPALGLGLGGKQKQNNQESDLFGTHGSAERTQFAMGILAGIMLQNAMMLRLQYNLGLTKFFKSGDTRLNALALYLSIPLWSLD